MTSAAETPARSSSRDDGAEIRTFLIADVRGYTVFTQEHGDEAAARLARRFASIARDAVEHGGGQVIELRGDEALAVFDSARRAIRGAVDLQQRFAEATLDDASLPLPVGIGLDVGEAERVEGGYRGGALNLAARLCSEAGAGEILASRETIHLARKIEGIRYGDTIELRVKGLSDPVQAVRVLLPMRFLVLGPLEVLGEDGTPVPIHGSKERVILADLIAHAGRVVSVDTLIDDLWGDSAPRTAEKTLASYVSRLRRDLMVGLREGSHEELIRTRGGGYSFEPAGHEIDAHRFERTAEAGRRSLAEGRVGSAGASLTEALTQWRGAAYQDHRYTSFGTSEGERLEELRRSAEEDLVDARLAAGDDPTLIADLEAMVKADPLRERRWGQLMLAMYRAGRQAEALHAFSRARSIFVEELGIEPGADLQRLQSAILAHDASLLEVRSPGAFEPLPTSDVCPYKGLARFETADAAFYFGRERTLARAISRLVEGRFLALVGASGSGKSSLLRAGVLNALEAGAIPGSDRWTTPLIRPGAHPLEAFRRALATESDRHEDRLVVAVDQFEETFTACDDESERAEFLDAIVDAIGDDRNTTVIVAMRADFYGRCAEYRAFAELLEAAQILVGPMDREELRRAIELPAERAGLVVEEGLGDALISATAGQPGGLPLLSTTLLELWSRRDDRTLSLAEYRRTGGVEGAVARLAEEAFGRLDPVAQAASRRILLRLAASGETLDAVGRQASIAELDLEHDGDAARALSVFTEARLVTVSDGIVEVAHEALLREWPRLRGWLEDDEQGRALHRHLIDSARAWSTGGRDDGDLYRGARLTAALEWLDQHERDPNDLERDFLTRSRVASEGDAARARRTNRRLRGLLAGVALLLAAAIFVGNIAISQRDRARAQGLIADARALAARSVNEEDGVLALLMARQAVALHRSAETESALVAALERSPAAIGMMYAPGAVTGDLTGWIRLSPDGSTLVAGGARRTIAVFDTGTGAITRRIDLRHATNAAAFDPNGRTLVVATDDQRLLGVDLGTGEVLRTIRTEGGIGTLQFVPSLGQVVTTETDGDGRGSVVFRDPVTLESVGPVVEVSRSELSGVAFAPDGKTMVTTTFCCPDGSDEGEATIWHLPRFTKEPPVPVNADAVVVSRDGRSAFLAGGREFDSARGGHLLRLDLMDARLEVSDKGIPDADVGYGLTGLALGRDGVVIATGDDGATGMWDPDSLERVEILPGPAGVTMRSPEVDPDGRTAYSVDINGTIVVWDLSGRRRLIAPFEAGSGNHGWPWFAISPDGATLAVVQKNPYVPTWHERRQRGSVLLIDASTLAPIRTIPFNRYQSPGFPEALAFSPDGRSLAVSAWNGYAQLFDVSTGRPLGPPLPVPKPRGDIELWAAPAFSPDGSLLAVSGHEFERGLVFVFETATGDLVRPLDAPAPVDSLQFTPNGRWLAGTTGDGPGHLLVWNVRSGTVVTDDLVDGSGLYASDVSGDGRYLVTGGQTSTAVRLWALPGGEPVAPSFGGPKGWVCSVEFSPSGDVLAAAADDAVYLWDRSSGTALGSPFRGTSFQCAHFAPDGDRLYVIGDGEGWVLDVDPRSWEARACRIAGRALTEPEWLALLPDRPYEPACTTPV